MGDQPSTTLLFVKCCSLRAIQSARIFLVRVNRPSVESSSGLPPTVKRHCDSFCLFVVFATPVRFGHEKRPDVCVTSGLDERRFKRSRCHMRKQYAGESLFSGVPPKSVPSHICSSRLDWDFDNMELSALACQALNCLVQRVRRETHRRVRQKSFYFIK